MSLLAALARLCPAPGAGEPPGCDLTLLADAGARIRCHGALLRARCPALPQPDESGAIEARQEEADAVYALLRWVYCEAVDKGLSDMSADKAQRTCAAVVRLAHDWGLRDAGPLQQRLAASKHVRRQCRGTLVADVLRAYDAGELEGGATLFVAATPADGRLLEEPEALAGGWRALLCERSAYFGAMFCGTWAESSGQAVRVRWDREQLRRLLRFLHGAPFVEGHGDLSAAVECAEFFGVPDLLESTADWIAANLQPATAPHLWTFLDGLRDGGAQAPDALADADEACFRYHVAHFEEICGGPAEEGEDPPIAAIHALSVRLFQRLLASGLVDAPTASLLGTVGAFAKRKAASGEADARALCRSLRPPAVLFNRECRSRLLPTATELSARSFV